MGVLETNVKELEIKLKMKDEKVEQFETVLRAMTRKVLSLETEIKKMKGNSKPREGKDLISTKKH